MSAQVVYLQQAPAVEEFAARHFGALVLIWPFAPLPSQPKQRGLKTQATKKFLNIKSYVSCLLVTGKWKKYYDTQPTGGPPLKLPCPRLYSIPSKWVYLQKIVACGNTL